MSEKDYIVEREKIQKSLEEAEAKLVEIQKTSDEEIDSDFLEKASYFIMVQSLLEDRYIDYEKYIRPLDPSIPRGFVRSIISTITIDNGHVSEIQFSNGMIHRFSYSEDE